MRIKRPLSGLGLPGSSGSAERGRALGFYSSVGSRNRDQLFSGALGASLLLSASAALTQESLCNPCVDGPVTMPREVTIRENSTAPSASDIVARLRELGGEFRDIAHDCGMSIAKRLEQIDFAARVCSWGGRYPALLFETVGSDGVSSLIVLAANGATVEVLFEKPPSASLARIFGGLLRKDFDELLFEIRERAEG